MTRAPIAMQEATDRAVRLLQDMANDIENDHPKADHKGRGAYLRRQARRMREALDAICAELDFHDPPADLMDDALAQVMTASPEWIEEQMAGKWPWDGERYRK